MFKTTVFLTLCFPLFVAGSGYPSTYPFENNVEENVPVALPAATPNYEFTHDTDPGGYIYLSTLCDLNSHDFAVRPYSMCSDCGVSMAHLVFTFSLPPVLPMQTWNCTASGFTFSASDFYGEVGGMQIECAQGGCCSDFVGKPAYTLDPVSFHEKWNKYIQIGSCTTSLPEAFYCAEIAYDWVCFDRYVSAAERTHVEACYDLAYVYFRSCPVFRSIGVNSENEAYETKLYLANLSPDESFVVYGVHTYNDRVCHPYSYYFPAAADDTDTDANNSADIDVSNSVQLGVGAMAIFFSS